MLPLTGTTLSLRPTGRLGSVPGPACENVTGPLAATVQVVSGIGIVTTIGVPETKFLSGPSTAMVVDAVTLSSRTCVAGTALVAASATQTRDGIAL